MNRKSQFAGISGLVLVAFGLVTHFLIANDSFNIATIQLLAGLALLILFVVTGGHQVLRSAATRRAAGFGASVTLYSALFIGVLLIVNIVASRKDFLHYDSTVEKVFTLAPQTIKVLDGLPEPIALRGFFLNAHVEPQLLDLLKRMRRHSGAISWKLIDPERNPALVERYGVSESGTIHLSYGSGASEREVKISGEIDEQELVNAILKLTRGGEKVVYYLTGHGEPDLEANNEQGYLFLKEAIEGENLQVKQLVLGETKKVPDDANAVILAAPQRLLLDIERKAIIDYVRGGGNAVLLHEPKKTDDIALLAKAFGVSVGRNVVVDEVMQLFAGPGLGVQPMITDYAAHPITEEFSEGTLFSLVSSVRADRDARDRSIRTELAFSSAKGWAESNIELLFGEEPTATLDAGDLKGPVPIAVAVEIFPAPEVEKADDGKKQELPSPPAETDEGALSRLVVIGDADFVTNVYIRQLFNKDFFLNSLNWVIGEEDRVSIRARSLRTSTKGISAEQFGSMFMLTSVLFPELLLICGLAIWWSRRSG